MFVYDLGDYGFNGMNPLILGELENFDVVYFPGAELFFEILGGGGTGGNHLNGPLSLRGTLYFLVHKFYQEELIIISLYFSSWRFNENFIFSPKIPIFFFWSLFLCNCPEV